MKKKNIWMRDGVSSLVGNMENETGCCDFSEMMENTRSFVLLNLKRRSINTYP